jgi:aerobic C4-dicarboxylate transport protein
VTATVFVIVGFVMRLAPLGAGAGIAFTVGRYGLATLLPLGYLVAVLYAACALFVVIVLGAVAHIAGLSLWALLRFIRDEILIVFGTCSTEAVLPQLIVKLEALGCDKAVVGLVLPAGYTFNTDGTSLYLAMAVVFIAQATGTSLSLADELTLLAVLLTSKGSAGVAGAGFVALAATLAVVPTLPVAGLVLLLGIDRFLNQARAVVNLIGNSVATLAIARWDGVLDLSRAGRVLRGELLPTSVASPA